MVDAMIGGGAVGGTLMIVWLGGTSL